MTKRSVFWVGLAVAAVAGFGLAAPFFYESAIGLDPSAYPFGNAIQSLVGAPKAVAGLVWGAAVLLGVALGVMLASRRARPRYSTDAGRRRLLTGAGAGVAAAAAGGIAAGLRVAFGIGQGGDGWARVGAGLKVADAPATHDRWLEAWKGSRIQGYRRLGRTGANVSDIGLGSTQILGEPGEAVVAAAVERGVSYIDTAPDYVVNGSEEAIGRAIRGRREGLFLATKFCTSIGHLPPSASVAAYKAAVEGSLGRLGTDRVDLVHIHACDSVERLLADNAHEAFDRLRQEGKARFLGFSSHTPNLIAVANAAIDSGRFDVMMVAYHFGIWADLDTVLARARSQQDMGVVAMKTLKGAKHHGLAGFREHADAYSQAAFRWVLSNPNVSSLVISFSKPQHVDEYLYASGSGPMPRDSALLREYDRQIRGSYCSPHCGECLDTCPESLPIPDVLRHRMYFEDYGWEKEGMRLYGRLEANASKCAGCPAPCLGACPVGIDIATRMRESHDLLTLG